MHVELRKIVMCECTHLCLYTHGELAFLLWFPHPHWLLFRYFSRMVFIGSPFNSRYCHTNKRTIQGFNKHQTSKHGVSSTSLFVSIVDERRSTELTEFVTMQWLLYTMPFGLALLSAGMWFPCGILQVPTNEISTHVSKKKSFKQKEIFIIFMLNQRAGYGI